MESHGPVFEHILRDMSDGVITLGMDGIITYVNPAAERMLSREAAGLVGAPFGPGFLERPENHIFVRAVLDAVYQRSAPRERTAPYYGGPTVRQLNVNTSYIMEGGSRAGVIAVIQDVTEMAELKDSFMAMERIRRLNVQLELRNKVLFDTFGRYLSDDIVRQLVDTPHGLEMSGKKGVFTVMMSDIRGFTVLSEHMPAQDLFAMLNHYLGEMTEIIQARNGTIIEFIGDGILTVFGAPLPCPTHAADAIATALEMQAAMEGINQWNRQRGYPRLEMGIGINSGEMIVGNIGSEKRTKYGVVGRHVNLCGRIESYTVGGQVLIAPMTRQLAGVPLCTAGEQQIYPKGAEAPLVISEVIGIGGDYGVYYERKTELPAPLREPVPVRFWPIRDKHTELLAQAGRITALSGTGAVLETAYPLEDFDEVQLDVGSWMYCKVLPHGGKGYLLSFTAAPRELGQWLGRMGIQAQAQ